MLLLEALALGCASAGLGATLQKLGGAMSERKKERKLRPINLVGGVLFPEPDDPRWQKTGDCTLKLGAVVVEYYTNNNRVSVDDTFSFVNTEQTIEYTAETVRAYTARVSQDSIENTP